MEKLIWSCKDYSIFETGIESLWDISKFVISQNYIHHFFNTEKENKIKYEDIEYIYNEEMEYFQNALCYIVRDCNLNLIGSIRVFKWDKIIQTPMQKIFCISPIEQIDDSKNSSYWHIGRFAIDSSCGIPTMVLFKQLMLLAIVPIMKDKNSYMLAETDTKLLRVMNALGIETTKLSEPTVYLASETVPVYSSRNDLVRFYNKCLPLIV